MNDFLCGYIGDRETALMAYLYDETTPQERAEFDVHLATCARCRTELAAFSGVRRQLAQWTPPTYSKSEPSSLAVREPAFISIGGRAASPESEIPDHNTRSRWWRTMPAWAQVAAAMLFLGVAAGIANLDVHYDAQSGLNIHTGWSRTPVQTASNLQNPATASNVVSKSDLLALERSLRAELRTSQQSAGAATASAHAPASNDAEVLRQVRVLIDQSERRQQSELALRVAAMSNEISLQRQADLRRIDMSLGRFQDSTGVEVLRNRQKLDYLLQRVSQQQ